MRASAPPTRLLLKEKKIIPTPSYFFFSLDLQCKSNAFTDGNTKVLFVVVKFIYLQLIFFFLFSKVKVGGGRIPLAGTQFFGWQMPFFLSWSRKTLFVYLFYFLGTSRIDCFALQIRPVRQSNGQPTPPFRKWKRGEVKLQKRKPCPPMLEQLLYIQKFDTLGIFFFPYIFFPEQDKREKTFLFFYLSPFYFSLREFDSLKGRLALKQNKQKR